MTTPSLYLHPRKFLVLAFIARKGSIYRCDKDVFTLDSADNIPGTVLNRARAQVGRGRQVMVFEDGCLKPDFCRITNYAMHCLEVMNDQSFLKLFRGLRDEIQMISLEQFRGHVARSFHPSRPV